ncbi:MAG: MerR family transcriptional regulator [Phenylobacterium sp.]|nr:MerR family transcriptional regulator [Phenylobacterium sp.]
MIMTKPQFLVRAGLGSRTLQIWLEQRWIIPTETTQGASFTDGDVARAHLIRDLRDDLGLNDPGIDVALHLLDQLHGVRRVLAEVRAAVAPAGDVGPPAPGEDDGRR